VVLKATTRSAFEYCPLSKLRMTVSRFASAMSVSTKARPSEQKSWTTNQVDGDVVRILRWGRDMVRDSQEPELNARPP